MTISMKASAGLVLLALIAACENHNVADVDAGDGGLGAAGDASCVMDAGPDVDPLMTCSPSGCFPFDNSVVPAAPRL